MVPSAAVPEAAAACRHTSASVAAPAWAVAAGPADQDTADQDTAAAAVESYRLLVWLRTLPWVRPCPEGEPSAAEQEGTSLAGAAAGWAQQREDTSAAEEPSVGEVHTEPVVVAVELRTAEGNLVAE